MDTYSESELFSLISQLRPLHALFDDDQIVEWESKIISLIIQIISVVKSMDPDSQPKPESKFMSLFNQTVSLFNSTDFGSLPKPLSELISDISHKISLGSDYKPDPLFNSTRFLAEMSENYSLDSYHERETDIYVTRFTVLFKETLALKPDPELTSLIRQIVSVVIFMSSKGKKLISLCPQVEGRFDDKGKFDVIGEVQWGEFCAGTWDCFLERWEKSGLIGEDAIHFYCSACSGEYHKEYEKAPLEIKHPLHRKHSLQLALKSGKETRECYCCDEDLKKVFYYCLTCDFAMNMTCVEKQPDLYIPPPKWHEHTLALFPRQASLTCNVCALADSSSPIYMCPPCDFVVHLRCIKLRRVLRISRHPHRVYHTPSFDEGTWSCGVCRRKIDNDYGGYSCIRDSCSYAAHSRCATQSNVWDGIDLEGEPEEMEEEEELEMFVRIGDKIIRHCCHDHHDLRLDENTCIGYDDNKQCQACVTPIYFGNFYSCVQCDEFVLHETCVNLSCKIYHPIHPHQLTIALLGDGVDIIIHESICSACDLPFTTGLFYKCGIEECHFKLHVHCATISEPLFHERHVHPLFLTSKPGEKRICCVCHETSDKIRNEESPNTFNCIECDGFSLCFQCAAIPQMVRYKHDKHILTLSYREETSTMMYWCEACEKNINLKEGFYMCDEYCCVTLHIQCVIGRSLYMNPGTSFYYMGQKVGVLHNNQMSRPLCSLCEERCSGNIVLQGFGSTHCSIVCLAHHFMRKCFNNGWRTEEQRDVSAF